MSDFIRLNGFDVKDQIARNYINSLKSLLGYEGEPGSIEKLTRIDNLDYFVGDLKELLGYVPADPGADGILGTEDDGESSKIGRLDEVQQKIDNIAEELGYKIEEGKTILDKIAQLESDLGNLDSKVEENSGSASNQFEDVQNQIDAIHKHDNLSSLNKITDETIERWDNKSEFSGSYNDLTDTPKNLAEKDYVTNLIPIRVSELENDVPYFWEADIIEQEMIDALVATFESDLDDDTGEGQEPSDEPAVPEDPEKPLEPDYPYEPGEEYVEEIYGENLIKNGRFKKATGDSIPNWILEGNIQIDDPAYQEVSEYFTLLLLDREPSYVKQIVNGMQRNTVYTLSYDMTWESAVSDYSIRFTYHGDEVYVNEFYETAMGHKNHYVTTPDMEYDYVTLSIIIHGLTQYSSDEANVFLSNFKLEEGFDETKWTEHPDLV